MPVKAYGVAADHRYFSCRMIARLCGVGAVTLPRRKLFIGADRRRSEKLSPSRIWHFPVATRD